MAQDNIKNLYDALKSDYDLGSEDDFRNSLKDANNRRNLYKAIEGDYDLGSEQDFEKALGYGNRVNGTNEADKPNTTTNTEQRSFTKEEYGRLLPTAQEAARGAGVAPNNGTNGADKANVQERKPRVQFVPEASNVVMATPTAETLKRYPWLKADEAVPFNRETGEPFYTWADEQGRPISRGEVGVRMAKQEITGEREYMQKQAAAPELPEKVTAGIRTDKSVTGYIDSLIRQQYGNDYQDKQWTTGDGRTVSGAELLENMAQETYDQLNNDVKEARIALFEANGDKDAESKINTAMITKWQGVMSDKRMLETLHDENAMKQDVKDYAQGEIDKAREEERRIIEEMNKRGAELDAASSPYVDQTFNTRQVDNRYTLLTTELNAVRDRIRSWEAVRDSDDYGAMRALKDTAGNLRSWDLGYSDMIKGMHLVFGTEQDKKELANLLGNAERAKNFEQKTISDFARYVQIAGQSLPFAAQFMATGGGFSGLSKGISKGAINWAEKRALQGFKKAAVKYLGVAAGDVVAGYTLSGTLQGMSTLGDIMQRKAGDIVYNQEKGEYEIANPNGWIESTYKGATASMIENTSELLGEHLHLGRAAMKLLPKAGLKQVSDWLTKAGKSELYTTTRQWLQRAGVNGLGGEIMEEEIAIPLNAVLVGDNPLLFGEGGLLDAKTQKDIIGGISLSVFAMNAATTAIYGSGQALSAMFDKDQRRLDAADNAAIEIIGGHKWTEIKNEIDNATNEELADVAQKIADDKGLNEEQKKAASEYITSTLQMRGHNLGENAAMQAREQRDTYLEGILSSEERQNVHDDGMIHAAVLYPDAQQGGEAQEVFITKGNVALNADGTIDTEASDKEIYYKGADGQVHLTSPDKLQSAAQPISVEEYAAANRPEEANEADATEEFTPGQVVNVNVDGQTYQATVQGVDGNGNVSVYYQDANGYDVPATFTVDEIRNANRPNDGQPPVGGAGAVVESNEPNGANEPNTPQNVATVNQEAVDNATVDDLLETGRGYVEGYYNEHPEKVAEALAASAQATADYINGKLTDRDYLIALGYTTGENSWLDGSATDEDIAAEATEIREKYLPFVTMPQETQSSTPQENEDTVGGSPVALSYLLENGKGTIESSGYFLHGVAAAFPELTAQIEEIRNRYLNEINPSPIEYANSGHTSIGEIRDLINSVYGEHGVDIFNRLLQNADGFVPRDGAAIGKEIEELTPISQTEQQQPAIPQDAEGNPIYDQTPVEATIADLYDGSLNDEEVQGFIDANIADAQKKYDSVQKKAPKIGTNKAKYLEQKRKWQTDVDEAKRVLDYWNEVNNAKESITHTTPQEVEAAQAEISGQNAREEYEALNDNVPTNPVAVASDFIRGAKITPESFRAETGYGTDEQRRFVGMIASAENGGKSIDRLAEELVSYDNAELNGIMYQGDTSVAKDAILEALQSAGTRGELATDNTAEQEQYVEARRAELDAQHMEAYHMTYEEYLAYEEQNLPEMLRKYANFDEVEFYNLYADEIEQSLNARINEQGNDTAGEEPRTGGGNEVLPGEGTDNARGSEGGTEQGAEVPAGVQGTAEDGAVPVEAQEDSGGGQRYGRAFDGRRQDNLSSQTDKVRIAPIGESDFGFVYDQFRGDAQGAIRQLMKMQDGEALGALHHKDIGDIDLVWGKAGTKKSDGYGLAKLVKFHPEVLDNLQGILDDMHITKRTANRIQLENDAYQAAVRLTWNGEDKIWLLTAFKKKETSEPANSRTDVESNLEGMSDDTATRQSSDVSSESKDTQTSANEQTVGEKIAQEEAKVEQNPTEAQKEAGNYKKGHVKIDGYDVTIENPKGSVRSGVDRNGQEWSVTMNNTYGYIRGTEGVDGDHIDVFLSDDPTQGDVYVIDQVNEDGSFDEHKVMYGFKSALAARRAYLANYSPGWQGLGTITKVSKEEFKKWINSSHRKTKPFAKYKSVNKDGVQNEGNRTNEADEPNRPLSLADMREVETSQPTDVVEQTTETETEQTTGGEGYGANNKLVSRDRYEELKKRMRQKLGGQLNMGIDPEILAIGTEMSAYHIEAGARKFADYARQMIADLGDAIRPYLKSFYNGARDLPEVQEAGYAEEMTPYDEVRTFDTANFDKPTVNAIETARTVVQEQEANRQAEEAKNAITEQRNEKERKKRSRNKKKSVSSQTRTPDLFGDLNEQQNQEGNETVQELQQRAVRERTGGQSRNTARPLGEGQRSEVEQSAGERVDTGSSTDVRNDGERSERLADVSEGEGRQVAKNRNNNHAERGTDYAPTTAKARYDANVEAVKLAKELTDGGQQATDEQKAVLRQFSGWGGLGTFFNNERTRAELVELLGDDGFRQAVMSINSAYYTPASVIDTMWDIVKNLGFKSGNILEGSAGIGNILGLMPMEISDRSNIEAVEIDGVSGMILRLLYPDAKVDIQGFENTQVRNGSVDLAITNVPFVTGLHVHDTTGDRDLSRRFGNIHDFCIAKNVRKLREGGIGVFISSSGTLDKSKALRDWVVNEGNADFIGAFRLNNKTFGGTTATSDIIVVRKRINGNKSAGAIDLLDTESVRTVNVPVNDNGREKIKPVVLQYNKYFVGHPENMGGEMALNYERGETFRPEGSGLFPTNGINQRERMQQWAEKFKDKAVDVPQPQTEEPADTQTDANGNEIKDGTLVVGNDGSINVMYLGRQEPLGVNDKKVKGHTKAECVEDYNRIKRALNAVLEYETTNEKDDGLKPLLKELNDAYDSFKDKYGNLNKNTAISFLRNDIDFPSIQALEKFNETNDKDGKRIVQTEKTSIFTERVVQKEVEPHPTNVLDAVKTSVFRSGRIDLNYISNALGRDVSDIEKEIIDNGLGYRDPATGNMEVSYEYLSGNVRQKLAIAEANNEDGRYDKNIKALRKVMPMDIPAHLIEFTFGSSWVNPKLFSDYVNEKTGVPVTLTNVGGQWNMDLPYYVATEKNKSEGVRSEKLNKIVLGTDLVNAAINNRTITVSTTQRTWDGRTETITDKEATQACAAKIDDIRNDFKDWARAKMQSDPEMAKEIEQVYNERFNNYVPKTVTEEFMPDHFPGATKMINLYPHQKKAVIRATSQPLMLAHEVGTGKTFTLITTAMEMRRLGLARKPMIVVQNATVGQFVASAKELYPNAKVLTIADNERNEEGRKRFYAKIKYNDWDMIVVPQSVFERIPDSEERQMEFINDRIEEKEHVLEQIQEIDPKSMIARNAKRELDSLQTELAEVSDKKRQKDEKRAAKTRQNAAAKAQEQLDRVTDDVENFDDMEIDAVLVDEAHEYKHLGFSTAMQRGVKGVDPSYSKKSAGVYLKTRAVMDRSGGKNVVFATGTPISNTAAEIWTFMRYLMPKHTMEEYGIYYFDDFVRNFGNLTQMLEFTTSGKFRENNRFSGYVNIPELIRIWSSVSDTVLTKETNLKDKLPETVDGGQKATDIYLPQSASLRSIMKAVRAELERFDNMTGKEKKENSAIPLVMYGIAKAAAIDPRLVMADAVDEPVSKTNRAVDETLKSLEATKEYKGTVAIFCDTYQNNQTGFNIYEEIKRKLVERGVPENQIVIMRSGMSVNKKAEIFDKVNAGDVRVIMGSTFTLGTGVNIQERLNTLIHLDAPNRPMDYTQRNGRILRQGNLHKEWGIPVKILRFGVEDSLDITAYQRLKTKGAIADSVMEGKKFINNNQQDRTLEEQEDVFGDTVAQLSGSEYALLKNQAERDFRKYSNKKKQYEADQIYVHNAIPRYEGQIRTSEETVKQQQKALSAVEKAFPNGNVQEITIGNSKLADQKAIGDYIKDVVNKKQTETEDKVRKGAQGTTASSSFTIKAGPFTFTVNTEYSKDTEYQNGSLFPVVHRNMTYSCDELGLSNVPVQRAAFKNAVDDIMNNVLSGNDMRERIETENNSIERNRSELMQLKLREGKPFENEKELEDARKKVEEYTEKMRKEMEAKEQKYAEMDAQTQSADLGSLSGAEEAEEDGDTLYREADGYNGNISINEEEANDLFRVVDDASEIKRLNSEPIVKVYRAMSLVDGKLYPPMSKKIGTGSNRVSQAPSEFGQWEVSDERPELVEKEGAHKNHIYIVKDNGKGLWVAYNPYFHTSRNPLNDQFAEAYQRPNLVTVEVEVPESELTSGYQAEGAKDPVGETKWNAGPVNRQLSSDKKRKVILSRWMRPVRIVPDSEVAQRIAELIEGENVAIPDNTVTPSLLEELKKLGVKIVDGISKGRKKATAMLRGGDGTLTDDELSLANAPAAALTGRPTRTAAQRIAFAERERQRMVNAVQNLAKKLHLDNIDIVTDASTLQGRRAKAKGFYSRSTGRITIVIPNHTDIRDVEQTLLHEAVAHYGLRQLFGEHFDTFLDNVFQNADENVRRHIIELAEKHGWDFRTATEEYLASLAENTNFENSMTTGWWSKIKQLFLTMLHKIGFENFTGVTLSDNELRYILWRSYENLAEPGRYRSIIGEVRDIAKQHELGVGNYATTDSQDRAADILGEQRMEEVDRQFNEELDAFKAKTHKGLLHLGQPGRILNACGINAELTLSPTVLSRKLKQHGLDVDDIKGLAGAIQKPILVYKHGDVHPNIVVVTDLTAKGGKISIAIELDGKGNVVELNNVSSVHSKVATTELERISNMRDGYLEQALRWVDKNKVSDWLGIADLNSPIHANNPKLVSVANILQNFENPSVEGEKNNDNVLYREADDAEEDLGHEWQDEYDRRTLSAAFKFTEAAQDGMKSVSILQDVISKETGKPIKEDENVWALQNRLSSTNKYEQDYFYENYYKPLMRAVGNLVKAGARYDELGRNMEDAQDDILKYLISKHGIERNAHFREVAAMEARRPYEESIEEIRKAVEEGEITQEDADKQIEKLTEQADEAEEKSRIDTKTRDYSGLSELYNNKMDFDALAEQYVSDFESKFDTADLWNKINAATKATLRKTYEAGLISRSGYEATRDMYQYYIPLRGWSNDVASEMYNYKGQQGVGGRIMKRAKGRKSLAENPLAVIGRMGQDGILQANKNRVKQRLYNLAIGHDTSLLSISRQWYVNEGTKENPDWQRAYPELSGDMGADEVAAALKEFDEEMKALQEEGMATQRRDGLTLKYHTTTTQEQQHRVNVSIGGREYNIYVNGNPRAAQAINGELRMDDEGNSIVQRVNRWLANVYTSLNPEFVVTNYERDAGFAAAIVAATETPAYQAGWIKNMAKFNPITTGVYINSLINKSTKGQINPDNTIEQYMQEFLANGGETGFTNMLTADDYKKLIKKEIKEVNKPITASKAGRVCFGWAQRANRVFEDATRFATYVTSREQGRSIDRAIRDAKEISLNFNTRGADGMKGDGIIYKFFRNLRHWFIFTNPSIQGLNKAGVAFSNHPVRSTLVIAGLPAVLGYGVAALASAILGGDDDEEVKNAYMDLPKWIRRTNICIPIGGTKFITIPLSYELRVAYGMGEMFWEIEQGMIEPGEMVKETVTQLSDLLPLSFASGTVAQNLSPTIVRPLIDIIQNKDFTGRPIYRENTFNQGMPEYTKAYAGTAKWLTKSSEVLNNAMPKFWVKDYPEPDKYTPGAINVNPAIVEHLLDSYLGGLYTFPAKAAKTVSMVWDEDMRDVRNIPFVNRNVKDSQSGNPITKSAGDRYNTYMKEYRLSKQRWNGYRRETNHGVTEFVPKLMKFTNSVQGQRMFIIDGYKKSLDELDKQVKDMGEYEGYGEDEKRKRLKQLSNDLKQELVNRLDSVSMRR